MADATTMKGENVQPTTGLKPLGLSSLRKTNLNTQLKPMTDSLSLSRKILSDKSNKGLFKVRRNNEMIGDYIKYRKNSHLL